MRAHRLTLLALASTSLVAQRGDVDIQSILGYIVVGAIVGVLARLIIPNSAPLGILGTIVVGIIGAVIGGWLAGAVFEETGGVDWIASVLVAAALVFLLRGVTGRRRSVM